MQHGDGALSPSGGRRSRSALAMSAVSFVLVSALLIYPLRAQEASRMALTGAIWDNGSIQIDGYPLGIDRAVRMGRTYSDKAPGQPILAVPIYAATQAVGLPGAKAPIIHGNWTLWLVTLGSATAPAVALFFVARRLADRNGRIAAT